MAEPRGAVLVTGGSGFIGGHCVLQLLAAGHPVRATIRSLGREPEVRSRLEAAGADPGADLRFVAADLTQDQGWPEAVDGCDAVLHVASPVPHGAQRDENEVIGPARDGTLRVLRAAQDAGVRRVVLTSAFHAVGFGWGRRAREHLFTEADWSVLDGPGMDAYGRSKTLAERAAWDASSGSGTELTVLNPVAVLGPALGSDASGANAIISRLLTGDLPGLPNLWIPIVDVRDVAAAEVAAVTAPEAAGKRILLSSGGGYSFAELATILRDELGERAARVPTRTIPDVVVRLMALVRPEFRSVAADLGLRKRVSTAEARRLLDWRPRDARTSVLDAARSMADQGLVGAD